MTTEPTTPGPTPHHAHLVAAVAAFRAGLAAVDAELADVNRRYAELVARRATLTDRLVAAEDEFLRLAGKAAGPTVYQTHAGLYLTDPAAPPGHRLVPTSAVRLPFAPDPAPTTETPP